MISQFGGWARRRTEGLWFNYQGVQEVFLFTKDPDWLCGPLSLLPSADQGHFLLWVKQLGHRVLKLRMSAAMPPLPIHIYGVHSSNFTLFTENYETYV